MTDRVTRDWQTGQVESRVLEERLGRARRKLATGRDARMRQGIAFSEKQLLAIASPRGRLAAVDGYLPPASSFRKRTDVDLEPPADRRGVSRIPAVRGQRNPTGVLVLMSSGAVAVAITAWRQNKRWALFISITVVFIYTSVTNMIERPEGIKIASVFIVSIVVTSLVSRTLRSTELRVLGIEPDPLPEVHRRCRPRERDQHHRQPAGPGRSERVRGQAARGAGVAPSDTG